MLILAVPFCDRVAIHCGQVYLQLLASLDDSADETVVDRLLG